MVVSLGPGKFYGTSLPRPRIYTDVKFNDHRVDPPVPVTDPLMSWAQEAHWSMGGLSFQRLRLQGKIEGNVEKLRSQIEKHSKAQTQSPSPPARSNLRGSKKPVSPSPPPAPYATKRRRFMDAIQEEEGNVEEDEEEVRASSGPVRKRRLVKKLWDDFDKVASSSEKEVAETTPSRTRTRKLVKAGEIVKKVIASKGKNEAEKSNVSGNNGVRTSPRLVKRGSN
ncbi:hypothetical protein RJT34_28923 [Clitoria ternatea]|uniref:Uncharacterized protein n=1 Tax=Clitoria ternatea TaxID=43366 RepID=A0AAN9IBT7_CLITE